LCLPIPPLGHVNRSPTRLYYTYIFIKMFINIGG
jgi:hypothetical protein